MTKQSQPIELRLPRETVKHMRRVAKLANVTVDLVVAVMLATFVAMQQQRKP